MNELIYNGAYWLDRIARLGLDWGANLVVSILVTGGAALALLAMAEPGDAKGK